MKKKPALHTPDGRYFVVRGRLWRLSNPALPPELRDKWVHQLMDARRALKSSAAPDDARLRARANVDEAKRGLGERGPVWWTDGSPDFSRHLVVNTPYAEWYADMTIRETTRRLLAERASEASLCPSEVARHISAEDGSDWRALMPRIRDILRTLVREGLVVVTRGTRELGVDFGAGPIRIRRGNAYQL